MGWRAECYDQGIAMVAYVERWAKCQEFVGRVVGL